jgi:hypothetical protein
MKAAEGAFERFLGVMRIGILLASFWTTGCGDAQKAVVTIMNRNTAERNERVERTLQLALVNSPDPKANVWRQFVKRWPQAPPKHGFAWREELQKFEGNTSAAALIEGRYLFKVIVDFELTADFQKLTFTKLRFHFAEVKRVVSPPGGASQGGVSILFQPDQRWFGMTEWERLVEAGWDFSSLGITLISNAPIQNIQSALPNL